MRAELAGLNQCAVPFCACTTILTVKKTGHRNIKAKMDSEYFQRLFAL